MNNILGRRIETAEYVNAATGTALDPPRRTRHVYFGLEVIQEYVCGGGEGGEPSNCCEDHYGLGCDDAACEAAVCAIDSWCCDVAWDTTCASIAADICCGGAVCDGFGLVREFVWGDPARYPEVVAMVTYDLIPTEVPYGDPPAPPTSINPTAYHYLHDVLGSVIGLVDEDGDLVERYTYDPYGRPFIETWDWDPDANGGQGDYAWLVSATDCGTGNPACGQMPFSAVGNPFMWTGHRYDAAVGLYHTLFRFYDPALGRWLQRDPIGYADGINLYEYVRSGPLTFYDPFGLLTFRELVKDNDCLKALQKLMWDLSQKEGREVSGEVNITDKGRLTLIMRLGGKDDVNPTTWWPKGRAPRITVGVIHTHPAPGHARGPSQQDEEFAKAYDLPNAVIHWVDDPNNTDNATKPKKHKTTFFGPKLDDELPQEINPDEEIRVRWTDEIKNKNLKIPLPKECKKKKKEECDNADKTPTPAK